MRVRKARVDLAGVEFVHDERRAVPLCHGRDPRDLFGRIDAADRVVGIREDEQFRAVLERLFQLFQIDAGAASGFFIGHVDGNHLAAEELDHLAISEIVRLYERDLIAGHDIAAHGEEEGTLRAAGQEQFRFRIDGYACKRGDAFRDHFQDGGLAFIRRIGLRSAFLHAGRKHFETAGSRGMRIDVAVAEVHGRAFQFFASEIQRYFFLLAFLTRRVVHAQVVEFFFDGSVHSCLLLLFCFERNVDHDRFVM